MEVNLSMKDHVVIKLCGLLYKEIIAGYPPYWH
jgi:hypothetical protein